MRRGGNKQSLILLPNRSSKIMVNYSSLRWVSSMSSVKVTKLDQSLMTNNVAGHFDIIVVYV